MPGDSEFELFHICRTTDCKFPASKSRVPDYLSSDTQTRVAKHVRIFSFTDKVTAAVPGLDIPGPREVAGVYTAPKKLVVGAIVVILAAFLRIKQALASIDVTQTARDAISFILYVILANMFKGLRAVENGVLGGIAKFYWDDHPVGTCGPLGKLCMVGRRGILTPAQN